jgi:Flp pilus assembly protein TadG
MPRPPRFLAAWGADRRGTVAIEFAFVAGPFLLMMFAVIELALVFLVSSSLDTASSQASRRIRTGEFQSAAQTEQQFKQSICSNMTWLSGDCMSALTVDVRAYTNFTSITDPLLTPVAGAGTMSFQPGNKDFQSRPQPSTIVVVRSYYEKNLITPFYNGGLARVSGSPGKTLILSTQVFRTEPFQPPAPTT